jgi:predicted Fe-Mo cluster-binding NifX family protein
MPPATMKVAIAQWEGRISPVFDVAGCLLLVEFSGGRETRRRELVVDADDTRGRAQVLANQEIDVLICGAISREFAIPIEAAGIRIVSQVCGEVDAVLQAFGSGELDRTIYRMPGCDEGQ